MNGDTQIYVSGREYKVPGDLIRHEQVVEIWNELHKDGPRSSGPMANLKISRVR